MPLKRGIRTFIKGVCFLAKLYNRWRENIDPYLDTVAPELKPAMQLLVAACSRFDAQKANPVGPN